MTRLLFRADGGHPIGTGHLFRVARVIRALATLTSFEAHIVTADDPVVDKIIEDPQITVHRLQPRTDLDDLKPQFLAASILSLLGSLSFDIVAIDMLDTREEEMRRVAARGVPLVTFDDRGAGRHFASKLINILVEEPEAASLPRSVQLIEGGNYVVLDPIFAEEHDRPHERDFGTIRNAFVAMGGADAAGLTLKVAKALKQVRGLERVELVAGPAFPHLNELEDILEKAPWQWQLARGYPSLIPPFLACDLAIVAGGLTMYEVCCLGTPSLAVCQPIDHQLELSDRLSALVAMDTVGWGLDATEEQIAGAVKALSDDPERRRRMSDIGPTIVDGRVAARVAQALLD